MTQAPVVALSEPMRVQVSQIDKQLNQIFQSQADGGATRASTFNLLVYECKDQDANDIAETIGAIAVQHPCRAIVISAAPQAPEAGLEALVAAYCPISESGNRETICCEYVTLRAKGQVLEELHTTVASLLMPDLQTFLWWRGPINVNVQLFVKLLDLVDRTIVDSSLFVAPENALQRVAGLILNPEQQSTFGDLNWSRLTPWREETALAFDSEERRSCLMALDNVVIEYGETDGNPNPNQAYLYLGWLASRLGWEPLSLHKKEGTRQIVLRGNDQPIQAIIRAVPISDSTQAGQIISIGLRSSDQGAACSVVVCGDDASSCMRVQMSIGETSTSQSANLQTQTVEQLLSQELQTLDRDVIFEQSLQVINKLLQQG